MMIDSARRAQPELSVRRLCALVGVGRSRYSEDAAQPTRQPPDVAVGDAIERLAEGGEETTEAVIALSEQHDMIVPPTDRPPYVPLDEVSAPPVTAGGRTVGHPSAPRTG